MTALLSFVASRYCIGKVQRQVRGHLETYYGNFRDKMIWTYGGFAMNCQAVGVEPFNARDFMVALGVHRCHRPLVYFLGKVVVCLSHTREISTCGVFHGEGKNGTCVWPMLHYEVAVNWIDDGIAFLCGFKTPAKFKHTWEVIMKDQQSVQTFCDLIAQGTVAFMCHMRPASHVNSCSLIVQLVRTTCTLLRAFSAWAAGFSPQIASTLGFSRGAECDWGRFHHTFRYCLHLFAMNMSWIKTQMITDVFFSNAALPIAHGLIKYDLSLIALSFSTWFLR